MGYVSNCFIVNMGNLFIVMLIFILLHVLKITTSNITQAHFVNIRNFLTGDLVWSNTIQFFLESFLVLAISCIINLHAFSWETNGLAINSTCAVAALLPLVGLPLFSFFWIRRNQESLAQRTFKQRFGSLYGHLAFQKGGAVLWEPVIY